MRESTSGDVDDSAEIRAVSGPVELPECDSPELQDEGPIRHACGDESALGRGIRALEVESGVQLQALGEQRLGSRPVPIGEGTGHAHEVRRDVDRAATTTSDL
jgi:hypothetical protein